MDKHRNSLEAEGYGKFKPGDIIMLHNPPNDPEMDWEGRVGIILRFFDSPNQCGRVDVLWGDGTIGRGCNALTCFEIL